MVPPGQEIPPAVVQVVTEWRTLMRDIREHFDLERRGKDTPHERVGQHRK